MPDVARREGCWQKVCDLADEVAIDNLPHKRLLPSGAARALHLNTPKNALLNLTGNFVEKKIKKCVCVCVWRGDRRGIATGARPEKRVLPPSFVLSSSGQRGLKGCIVWSCIYKGVCAGGLRKPTMDSSLPRPILFCLPEYK